jgi:hypothetical protein
VKFQIQNPIDQKKKQSQVIFEIDLFCMPLGTLGVSFQRHIYHCGSGLKTKGQTYTDSKGSMIKKYMVSTCIFLKTLVRYRSNIPQWLPSCVFVLFSLFRVTWLDIQKCIFLLLMKLVSSIGFYVPDNVAWSHFQIYLLKSIWKSDQATLSQVWISIDS